MLYILDSEGSENVLILQWVLFSGGKVNLVDICTLKGQKIKFLILF